MKQLSPDLWQTSLYKSGALSSHAYYLKTSQGGVLLYNTGDKVDLDEMNTLGGIDYQLLTHRDESTPSQAMIREKFGCKLVCSEYESPSISKNGQVDIALEAGDHDIYGIKILATPGHTGGSLSFYYTSEHGNYLFTGDTIFQWEYRWATLVFSGAGGNSSDLINSLDRLKGLNPNIVMSSGFIVGDSHKIIDAGNWPSIIEETKKSIEV